MKNFYVKKDFSPFFILFEYTYIGDYMIYIIILTIISILLSTTLGIILIPSLRKRSTQVLSIYLSERHSSKTNIPTMGGVIFIIPPISIILVLLLLHKINFSYNLITVLFTVFSYGLIGFIDDYLIIKRHNNQGLSEYGKLVLEIICATIIFYLFLKGNNEPLLWIHTINFKVNIGWMYGFFILLVLTSSSNAVNITDGLDGLAGGLSVIAFFTLGIITYHTGWLEGYIEITYFIFSLTGSLISFLLFNTYPAKVFMGDTGSLALGASLGILAILTRHEVLLIVIGIVFVIETLTCIIQRIYYKFTRRRIFPITPIHHTFERYMPEVDVVKIFWLFGLVGSLIALIFGVCL